MARSIPDDIRASLAAPMKRLARLDPFTIFTLSNEANQALLEAQAHIAELRRGAVRQLRSEGYTLKEISEQVGASIARIHQIESGYDRREKQDRAKHARNTT